MTSAKPILVTAALAVLPILVAFILLHKDPGIPYSTFDPRFALALHQANFQTFPPDISRLRLPLP